MKLRAWVALGWVACTSAAPRPSVRVGASDPFAVCVAPYRVGVVHEGDTALIVAIEAQRPSGVIGLAAAAERCGAWAVGDEVAPHLRAIIAHERCGDGCEAGWEARLARAIARAPAPAARCEPETGPDWVGWAVATLLDPPDLALDLWVERAIVLGRAGIGVAEEYIEARLGEATSADAMALARVALAKLPHGAESMRFQAAMALVRGGAPAEARSWLNQVATHGRTAFRAFARSELDRLE